MNIIQQREEKQWEKRVNMTMNKKEKEYVEMLEVKAALRWTEEIKPDLPPPEKFDELSKGFLFNEYEAGRVAPACSSGAFHSFGRDDKTTSQGSKAIYSTKLLALKALRYAMEMRCAKQLRCIDLLIREEEGKVK